MSDSSLEVFGRLSQMRVVDVEALTSMRAEFIIRHRSRIRIKCVTSQPMSMTLVDELGCKRIDAQEVIGHELVIFHEEYVDVMDRAVDLDSGRHMFIVANTAASVCHVGFELTYMPLEGTGWVERASRPSGVIMKLMNWVKERMRWRK